METRTINAGGLEVMEIVSPDTLIRSAGDALEIIAGVPADCLVLHAHNLESDFFDLSTRKLGELLQKFVNYRVRLAVVGDFEQYPSKALSALIYESNRTGQHLFVPSVEEALRIWQRLG